MLQSTDQLGREISVPFPPKRIISLVPSQTELLYDLGLEEKVIGITKFCVHPEKWFRTKTRIGGTRKLDIEKIRSLQPDLIIGNKEENDREQIAILMKEFPVWISDIKTVQDAYDMMEAIGVVTGRKEQAKALVKQIRRNFGELRKPLQTTRNEQPTTVYFIWRNPWMVAGGNTFINEMLKLCGFENIFEKSARYPEINPYELATARCQLVLLSSEPYPFKEKHIAELQEILPSAKILLVDGEMFSWYGSRTLRAPAYFQSLRRLIENP